MEQENKSYYNKNFKHLARKLRNNSTRGEILLWTKVLSKRKMLGYQFLRQFPIDNYIADFICRKVHLIIEIDGYSHINKFEQDAIRDARLKELGYTTIRFQEREIYAYLANVERAIEDKIREIVHESP